MNIIQDIYKDREDLARVLKKHTGIRKIVEDLYPDSAHFIYELLQNAEDTGATEITFILSEENLIFEHNGRTFSRNDIEAITDIGEGTKDNDDDKIGRFGIGFKAVFAYSETPHIWSPSHSFKITDLVLPNEIKERSDIKDKTHFEFPFNNPKKPQEDAYIDIENGLNELAETTLLFLSNIESINWKIGEETTGEILRIQHSEHHLEVLKQINGAKSSSSHFLKFNKPVDRLESQNVSVAYVLDFLPKIQHFNSNKPIVEQLRIIPANPGNVSVFFPAEKETSGLRFHLHAPFVPELSRASIKDTPANSPLFKQLATLVAESLHNIRDLKLLTRTFLEILPSSEDVIPERYKCVRSSVIEAMNTEPLTPTHSESHEPAQHLIQAKASLKNLLSRKDLEFLVDYDETAPQWAIGAKENSPIDKFLKSLEIKEWGLDEFIEIIESKTKEDYYSEIDDNFMAWLASKPIEWHQQFYALLYDDAEELYPLKDFKIIRLNNGNYSVASKCYFPGNAFENDEILLRIDSGIFTSGEKKKQKEKESARNFLEKIGVKEVGEAEQIEVILQQRYTKDTEFPDDKTHWKDLKRFIDLVEKQPEKESLFQEYLIFKIHHEKYSRCAPSAVFIDSPFEETGLSAYFDALKSASKYPLDKSYLDSKISKEKIANFAKLTGAQTELKIKQVSCRKNPEVSYLVYQASGKRTYHEHDMDWDIDFIEKVIHSKISKLSQLIWNTISNTSTTWYGARYKKNAQQDLRWKPSQLAVTLTNNEWIPQKSEGDIIFVYPKDATQDLLPDGFAYDSGWKWLDEIGFGKNAKSKQEAEIRQSETVKRKETNAKIVGFKNAESLEEGKWFADLPQEEREKYKLDYERKQMAELPEHEPSNPERRSNRVTEQATEASEKITEKRTRSVSVNQNDVKEQAAEYLLHQYTNPDGDMICQICKDKLPFKLNNGNEYFEKIELLKGFPNHHPQNHIALCPNHAAMFKHTNETSDTMLEVFQEISSNELDVVLAECEETIYFTKTHIADLKSVITASEKPTLSLKSIPRDKSITTFSIGEEITVLNGPFSSFTGIIKEIDEKKENLKVLISMFGRETPATLEYKNVRRPTND